MTSGELVTGAFVAALYALLTTALYYLGARAQLTEFLWSRYPKRLDTFMVCSACSGFWYGVAVAFGIGWYLDVPFLLLPGRYWLTPVLVGLGSLVWTPLLAAKHLAALEGTALGAPPAVDHSPESYGTDASPTKEADLALAGDLNEEAPRAEET